jgi:hypothetical protein
VILKPGSAPGRVKLTGPSEAVQRLTPLVAQCKTALLEVLTGRQAAPEPSLIAANRQELERMVERTEMFERMGLAPNEVDWAVDRLHQRDREGLRDMHLCVECARLRADATGWRCAALGPIPTDWVTRQLQRCGAFLRLEPATGLQPR